MDYKLLFEYLKGFMSEGGWHDGNTAEQARAIFTTICFIGNIDADTAECDNMLFDLYNEAAMEDLIDYVDFELFMISLIV